MSNPCESALESTARPSIRPWWLSVEFPGDAGSSRRDRLMRVAGRVAECYSMTLPTGKRLFRAIFRAKDIQTAMEVLSETVGWSRAKVHVNGVKIESRWTLLNRLGCYASGFRCPATDAAGKAKHLGCSRERIFLGAYSEAMLKRLDVWWFSFGKLDENEETFLLDTEKLRQAVLRPESVACPVFEATRARAVLDVLPREISLDGNDFWVKASDESMRKRHLPGALMPAIVPRDARLYRIWLRRVLAPLSADGGGS